MKFTIKNNTGEAITAPIPCGKSVTVKAGQETVLFFPQDMKDIFKIAEKLGLEVTYEPSNKEKQINKRRQNFEWLRPSGLGKLNINPDLPKETPTAKKKVELTRRILKSLEMPVGWQIPTTFVGASFSAISFPSKVMGTFSDNESMLVRMRWEANDFNGEVAGEYHPVGIPDDKAAYNPENVTISTIVYVKELPVTEESKNEQTTETVEEIKEEVKEESKDEEFGISFEEVIEKCRSMNPEKLRKMCDILGMTTTSNKINTLVTKISNADGGETAVIKAYLAVTKD